MLTSNFQPIRFLDPDCWYKFTYIVANSADPDHLASSEANWSGFTLFAKAGHIQVQQDQLSFRRPEFIFILAVNIYIWQSWPGTKNVPNLCLWVLELSYLTSETILTFHISFFYNCQKSIATNRDKSWSLNTYHAE